MTAEILDVVQVGYGPVGQVLAAGLGAAGHRVQVVERHTSLYQVSRAGTLDGEVMRTLQGLGLADELGGRVARNIAMLLLDADRQLLTELSVPRDSVSGWHASYTMYQPELEVALDRVVRAEPGVEVVTGADVVALRPHDDHVEVDRRDRATGEVVTSRARYVIGADGANSAVRELSGLARDDLGYTGPWLVCDFEHHDPDVALPFRAGFVLDPARPLMFGRWLARRHSRMEFMLLPGEDQAAFDTEEACWALSKEWGITPDTSSLVRHAVYEFGSLLAPRWRNGRVLLAGDAAHVMPPFLGQGFCSGVRDAANLTWKLDLVLRGVAGEDLLDTYELERRAHVEAVIRMSMGLGELISMTDPVQAAGRDEFIRAAGAPPNPPLPHLLDGIVHRGADGTPDPGAGELSLQARVGLGGRTGRLDDIVGGGWRILTRVPLDRDALSAGQRRVLDDLGVTVVVVSPADVPGAAVDVDLDYEAWFDSLGVRAVVVRPDFYTYAAVADPADLGAVLDDLGAAVALR